MKNTALFELTHKYLTGGYQSLFDEIKDFNETSSNPDVKLLSQWFLEQLDGRLEILSSPDVSLKILIGQARDLENFVRVWTLYEIVWAQRAQLNANIAVRTREFGRKAINIGDTLVHKLYEVVTPLEPARSDYLGTPRKAITVIPALSRPTAGGFDTPAPYIITPRWGYTQPWNWLSYAHEVGHHVYRNIDGLSDELKVKMTLNLAIEGVVEDREYAILSLWYQWLEEIFADLFGLLQIGPAYASSQQVFLLLSLPARSLARPDYDPRRDLLAAHDFEHPIAHIRVYLALTALELLGTPASILQFLWESWDRFMADLEALQEQTVYARIRQIQFSDKRFKRKTDYRKPIAIAALQRMGRRVLEFMLQTPLDALADGENNAQSIETVFQRSLPDPADIEQASEQLRGSASVDELPDEIQDIRNILAVVVRFFEQTEDEEKIRSLGIDLINHYHTLDDESGMPHTIRSILHTVKPDEKIMEIAERFYEDKTKYEVIKLANNLETAEKLEVGQQLIIPFFE